MLIAKKPAETGRASKAELYLMKTTKLDQWLDAGARGSSQEQKNWALKDAGNSPSRSNEWHEKTGH